MFEDLMHYLRVAENEPDAQDHEFEERIFRNSYAVVAWWRSSG